MTANQIKKIRDLNSKDAGDGKRIAGSIAYIFNNEVAYIDSRDYVVCDDDNELIHCVRANTENPVEQARFPFRITTGFYENIQYLEALYDMANFKKALEALLLEPGLITDDQLDQILVWADGVRNQTSIPKQPGPYFKDTILPIGHSPIPEIRHDGLHHAAPTNLVSAQKKIEDVMTPLIESMEMAPVKRTRNIYDVNLDVLTGIGEQIKDLIESFTPMGDLYMATFSDIKKSVIYNPKVDKTVDNFATNVDKMLSIIKPGSSRRLILYVEAYNARVEYSFYVKLAEPENPFEFKNYMMKEIGSFISETEFESGTMSVSGSAINTVINTSDIGDDVTVIVEFLNNLDADNITCSIGGKTITLNIGDAESVENFKKGVIELMPTENGATVTGTAQVTSAAGNSVTYTLKVKYYNEEECPVNINGVPYISLQAAMTAAMAGDTVTLVSDIDLPTAVVVDKDVTVNLNGKTLTVSEDTAGDGVFHVTAGTLTIDGDGTVNGLGKNAYSMAVWADGGDVIINGGTYTNVGAGDEDHYDLIYAKGSTITINGGSYTCQTPKWTLNCKDNNGTIIVKGGSFTGYDPSHSETEDPIANFVADGYTVVESNGIYTVIEKPVEDTIDEIIAAIPEDSGLIIEEDATAENTYNIITSSAGISQSGIFDSIAAVDGLTSITITDGISEVVYTAGGDLDAFKASVDSLTPSSNTAEEVILTMTVVTE